MGRAWVSVSADYLIQRLGLPKGTRLICADMNSSTFSLRLGLDGDAFPKTEPGIAISEVTAQHRVEESGNVRKIFLSLSHDPQKEWLVDERIKPHLRDTPEQHAHISPDDQEKRKPESRPA